MTQPQPNKTIDSGLDAAIIYSGKHVGHWDDNLSKGVKAGTITRLLLDLPALKEALQKTIAQEANKTVISTIQGLDWRSMGGNRDTEDDFDTWREFSSINSRERAGMKMNEARKQLVRNSWRFRFYYYLDVGHQLKRLWWKLKQLNRGK